MYISVWQVFPPPPHPHGKMQLRKRIQIGRQILSLHTCTIALMHKYELSAVFSTILENLPPDCVKEGKWPHMCLLKRAKA